MGIDANSWYFSPDHGQLCQIIESQTLWGEATCRVWLPGRDSVVRVPASRLSPLKDSGTGTSAGIVYVACVAKVADALTQDVLLAPIESSVIPLPHQIRALSRAIANDRVRYLLADEVGLGKTIEAGLIMRELKLRGLVRRTLVVSPKGLVFQWIAEMRNHLNEGFHFLNPSDFSAYRRIWGAPGADLKSPWTAGEEDPDRNLWRAFDQVITSLDAVKPIASRRGWSKQRVSEYNQERVLDLAGAGWDLIIFDEAHRLGGSADTVARYRLGRILAEASPYLLLLSATPHQGKTESFHRLISLVDEEAFPDPESISRERVRPYVIRTEKRQAIDAEGKALFKERHTRLAPISWQEKHNEQKLLYEAVTEYVREGYNRALREKQTHIGFLLILMQRLVVSSTRAIRATLNRRLEALELPQEQLSLFPMMSDEDWQELDSEEQVEMLVHSRLKALKSERQEVKFLLEVADRCEQSGPDAKAEALLDWIYRLQQDETDPDLKVLVFTEFVATQQMLAEFLALRGISVVCLNGSMDMEERNRVQEQFSQDARILVSTDAGGEGLNLQFCHVVVNFDIPWNPMKLEQRIGRVDRIGQKHTVRAINFALDGTVECRVREVLEEKLKIILYDLGIDKTSDVLDSTQSGHFFDGVYVKAILAPEQLEKSVNEALDEIRKQAAETHGAAELLGSTEDLDPDAAQKLKTHPLSHWVERMTTSYLVSHGGTARRDANGWTLTWPDREVMAGVIFSMKEAEDRPLARFLTLESPRIRGLASRLPRFVPGQPVPEVTVKGLPAGVLGFWSLWRIQIHSEDWNRQKVMSLFIHDDGRLLPPTAERVWDELLSGEVTVVGFAEDSQAEVAYATSYTFAEQHGKSVYEDLLRLHHERLGKQVQKGEYSFTARRRALERIGLPEVRNHRLSLLEKEKRDWQEESKSRETILPELTPLIMIRIAGGN